MSFRTSIRCAIAFCATFILAGCGGSKPVAPQKMPISGMVTLDDQPLPQVEVRFHPQGTVAKELPIPAGKTDDEGRYELITDKRLGVVSGKYKVTVRGANVPAKYAEPGSSDIEKNLDQQKRITGFDIVLKSDSS